MAAAPLSWLAKIGGDTLKTKAKLLSSAINELYDDGQCKIVAVVDNTADNGKTVLITTDANKTYSGTIANKKCEFLLHLKHFIPCRRYQVDQQSLLQGYNHRILLLPL